jgi:hypothetical protein
VPQVTFRLGLKLPLAGHAGGFGKPYEMVPRSVRSEPHDAAISTRGKAGQQHTQEFSLQSARRPSANRVAKPSHHSARLPKFGKDSQLLDHGKFPFFCLCRQEKTAILPYVLVTWLSWWYF